jgi:hypothetical protein
VAKVHTYADCLAAIDAETARLGRSSVIDALRNRARQIRTRELCANLRKALPGEIIGYLLLALLAPTFIFLGCLL